MIPKRIDYEINRRIIQPFLNKTFDYMSASMNWNIWIEANVLQIALLNVEDATTRNAVIVKTIKNTDNFLNGYPEDGGCDEGPHYWTAAGGRLIEFLTALTDASNNCLNWSSNLLIKNIGDYFYKIHINRNRFVNFADSEESFAKELLFPYRIYLYGKYFNDEQMKHFAAYANSIWESLPDTQSFILTAGSGNLNEMIKHILYYSSVKSFPPTAPFPRVSYFPNLQALTARSQDGTEKGLFVGLKAGHNGGQTYI